MAASVQRLPSAVDIIESEEYIQHVNPALLNVDYNDMRIKYIIAGGSFTFFTLILTSIICVSNLFSTFRKLDIKFKVFLSLSIVRGLFGIFSTIVGVYAIFVTTNLQRDIVFGRTATSTVAMLITVGFFIFELATVILSDIVFKSFSKMLIIHHLLGVLTYTLAVTLNVSFSFGCKALILEISTPFSCLSYVLLKAGMERSTLWKINQTLLVHSFHIRSLVECYLWYITFKNWQYIWTFLPTSLLILTYVSLIIVTFIMTPYWGYKKTQQLFHPVDWNFQESRNNLSNGNIHFTEDNSKKAN